MPEARLLLVEDDVDQRKLVAGILRGQGYAVAETGSVDAALADLAAAPVDLVLSDWKLPGRDGMELLAEVKSRFPETGFLMATAYGTIAHAVSAVRAGADDYLTKPFERAALLLAVERTLRSRRLADENRRLSETDATVLLAGESGTGKELAARALHALSRRRAGPFVAVNAAAIPETLVEAEFFGSEKGSYTGADRLRKGKLEQATGGTLFLDEVGELPLPLQPKLLRALQEGVVTRIGGAAEIATDARILAATNRDLGQEVAAGRFREDLYYRLNVVSVTLPPLRERREDVPLLVRHFVARTERRYGIRVEPFPAALLARLVDHAWPGNVRELANVVERLVLLSEGGRVSEGDLPDPVAGRPAAEPGWKLPPGGLSWEDHEKEALRQALELSGGNRARAARLLDLPYKAFLYRLEKFGLAPSAE